MNIGLSFSTNTRFCAVIGDPIEHSLSPAIHNAAFRELGLDYVYLACRVEDLKGALQGMKALGNFTGLSITIPHKIDAMKYVDEVDPVDSSIGSINTVIKEGGILKGFGTDGPGACRAVTDAGFDMKGKNILMLGAGGAARAIAFTIASNYFPGTLTLLDLNEITAKNLANDIARHCSFVPQGRHMNSTGLAQSMEDADLVINCTPVGMHPNIENTPVPGGLLRKGQTVFDIVYNPLMTRLLKDAQKNGLNIISGADMFINQAVLQFKAFTGIDAPVEVMRKVVMENLVK